MSDVAKFLYMDLETRLVFKCPGCKCDHGVPVMYKNQVSGPLWSFNGSLDKPTLTPSILVTYGMEPRPDLPQTCHSYVKEGMIQFLGDCAHSLAGQTVALEAYS